MLRAMLRHSLRCAFTPSVLVVVIATAAGCAAPPPPPPHDHREHHAEDHHPGTVHHSFADAERWSREFDAVDRDGWQKPDEVVSLMAITAGQTVVDLGAGTGYFLARLSKAAGPSGKVIGLDIEPNMVDHMAKRASRDGLMNVEARRVALDGSDLPQGVDRFLIVDTWHHIDARGAYAKKLAAALKPGGAVIVVDFTRDAPKGPPATHRLSPESVMAELAAGGFESRLAEESLPHQYVVVAKKR